MELKQRKMPAGVRPVQGLLIVPYGIETKLQCVRSKTVHAFNRTLWN